MPEYRDNFTVYIVDDDAPVRDSLALLLSLKGYRCAQFATAEDFLSAIAKDACGCLITDLRLPGMDGLALQQELIRRDLKLPLIVITAHGDVAAARTAFKFQAVDFLEKPFSEAGPIEAVEAAFRLESARLQTNTLARRQQQVWSELTPRERDVIVLVVEGQQNRDIAEKLGISPRTVEVHKARAMDKVGARNLADLIRMAGESER